MYMADKPGHLPPKRGGGAGQKLCEAMVRDDGDYDIATKNPI